MIKQLETIVKNYRNTSLNKVEWVYLCLFCYNIKVLLNGKK